MGHKYPLLKPRQIIRALEKMGFNYAGSKGSHLKYVKNGRPVIIPNHDIVARGTLQSILQQAGISLEELLQKL